MGLCKIDVVLGSSLASPLDHQFNLEKLVYPEWLARPSCVTAELIKPLDRKLDFMMPFCLLAAAACYSAQGITATVSANHSSGMDVAYFSLG
jgi:hypothetical protein